MKIKNNNLYDIMILLIIHSFRQIINVTIETRFDLLGSSITYSNF